MVAAQPSADRGLARSAIDARGAGLRRHALPRGARPPPPQLFDGRSGTHRRRHRSAGERLGRRRPTSPCRRRRASRSRTSGRSPPNLAVTAVRALGDRFVATVRNAGARRARRARAPDDRRPARRRSAGDRSAPNQSPKRRCPGAARRRRRRSRSTIRRERAGDNVRYVVLERPSRPAGPRRDRAGRSRRDAFYVQHALAAAAGRSGAFTKSTGVGGTQLSAWIERRLDVHAAVVLLSTRGLEQRGRELLAEYVRSGGGAWSRPGRRRRQMVAGHARRITLSIASAGRPERGTAARAGAGRRPPSGASSRSRAHAAPGPGDVSNASPHRRHRLPDAGAVHDRRDGAGRLRVGRRPRTLVLASDLDNALERFSAARDVRAVLHEVVRYLAGARPRASATIWSADVPAGVQPCRASRRITVAGAGTARVAVNVDPAESAADG